MKRRIQYTFTGRVQGVGFRYRAYHAAHSLGLTGWVRNEPDGSVTMEVQGEQHVIDSMLGMIKNSSYIRIDNLQSTEIPLNSEEPSFKISY